MRKLQMCVVVALVSVAASVAVAQFYDGPFGPPPRYGFPGEGMPVQISDFSGEVIIIPRSDGQQGIFALARPQVRRLGNRQYLVGRDLSSGGPGHAEEVNVTLWLPLDRTSELYEYKTVEDARKVWKLGGGQENAAE